MIIGRKYHPDSSNDLARARSLIPLSQKSGIADAKPLACECPYYSARFFFSCCMAYPFFILLAHISAVCFRLLLLHVIILFLFSSFLLPPKVNRERAHDERAIEIATERQRGVKKERKRESERDRERSNETKESKSPLFLNRVIKLKAKRKI